MNTPVPPATNTQAVRPVLPEQGPVPSPCVNICRMDARGEFCEGCQRTLDEIAAWSGLDDAAKRAVWARLDARRAAAATAAR